MSTVVIGQPALGKIQAQLRAGACFMCGQPTDRVPFRDRRSAREAEISGMCQTCQDNFFGKDDE